MAYSDIKDPSEHFQVATYTGNGGTLSVTNDGNSDLQPDWVWIHNRAAYQPQLYDTTRGVHKKIMSSITNEESTDTTALTAFNTDGFSTGANVGINQNNVAHVAWQWKANGGTTATNTSGTVDSVVQANTDAGMSIVTYTGTGGNITVGHGLGVAPSAIIIKSRSNASPWVVWTAGMAGTTSVMELNTTAAEQTVSNYWYNGFSSTTFGLGTGTYSHNTNNYTYVAYCFAEKQGYSKFGSYVGNGVANGTFVYTGFKPAFIMVKTTAVTDEWNVYDTKRSGFNPNNDAIYASVNYAEDAGSTYAFMDIVSNGFKLRRATHSPNKASTYIYMAFAEQPFVTSTGTPTTAR
jgi:hypothetical protein